MFFFSFLFFFFFFFLLSSCLSYFVSFKLSGMFKIINLMFRLFTQVSDSGPQGPLVFHAGKFPVMHPKEDFIQ